MPEKAERSRFVVQVKPEEHTLIKGEATQEGISVNELTIRSLAIRRALRLLAQTESTIFIHGSDGNEILNMPTSLLITFLEGDPLVVGHFLQQRTPRP